MSGRVETSADSWGRGFDGLNRRRGGRGSTGVTDGVGVVVVTGATDGVGGVVGVLGAGVTALPPRILNITVPQVGHLPLMAFRPFFMTSSTPSAISFLALHLTQ